MKKIRLIKIHVLLISSADLPTLNNVIVELCSDGIKKFGHNGTQSVLFGVHPHARILC